MAMSKITTGMASMNITESMKRPGFGKLGRAIGLRANHFAVTVKPGEMYHYDLVISPEVPKNPAFEVVKQMLEANKTIFAKSHAVFDGRKNMYTCAKLQCKDGTVLEVVIPDERRERKFKVTIKLVAQITIKNTVNLELSAIQGLDIVFRQVMMATQTPAGRSFFPTPQGGHGYDLGGGLELWHGQFQSVRQTSGSGKGWAMTLNIDVAATAFFKAQPAINLIAQFLGDRVAFPLIDAQRRVLKKKIEGIQVETTHCGKRRKRVVGVGKAANQQSFPMTMANGKTVQTTVAEYFKKQYNITLRYPNYPCLEFGTREKTTYLPIEVCTVVEKQRCLKKLDENQTAAMIKQTAQPAPNREREINGLIQASNFNNNAIVKGFGLSVSTSMAEINGRVLEAPKLQFQGKQALARQGAWDIRGQRFHTGKVISKWAVVCFADRCPLPAIENFKRELARVSKERGMAITENASYQEYHRQHENVEKLMEKLVNNIKGLQLIIVILDGRTPLYGEVKRIGDTKLGISTQIVQALNVKKAQEQTLSNLLMKINVKLGGVNSVTVAQQGLPAIFREPVIFIGADVTHPAPGESKPSIAAVVGSMDMLPSRYAATISVQEARREIIFELKTMVIDLLKKFYTSTRMKPVRIVFYRDGVSEGQYREVLCHELRAIREACESLQKDYHPKMTFVVVGKRHHTRLFAKNPNDRVGKSENVPAGTVVDTGIVHPTEFDFYLCSHAGIQGTSRPSHYHCLYDENNFGADGLQALSFMLCHTYVRCTRSVSIPAPVYYAHLAAFRARYHIVESDGSTGGSVAGSHHGDHRGPSLAEMNKLVQIHAEANKVMYFA